MMKRILKTAYGIFLGSMFLIMGNYQSYESYVFYFAFFSRVLDTLHVHKDYIWFIAILVMFPPESPTDQILHILLVKLNLPGTIQKDKISY